MIDRLIRRKIKEKHRPHKATIRNRTLIAKYVFLKIKNLQVSPTMRMQYLIVKSQLQHSSLFIQQSSFAVSLAVAHYLENKKPSKSGLRNKAIQFITSP